MKTSQQTKDLKNKVIQAMKLVKLLKEKHDKSYSNDRNSNFNNYFSSINLKPRVYQTIYTGFSKVQ